MAQPTQSLNEEKSIFAPISANMKPITIPRTHIDSPVNTGPLTHGTDIMAASVDCSLGVVAFSVLTDADKEIDSHDLKETGKVLNKCVSLLDVGALS